MSSQLRNIWRSIPLHKFQQGSTLSIRTSPRLQQQLRTPLAIVITPEWRDDAHLALSQTLPFLPNDDRYSDVGSEAVMNVTYRDDDDHPIHVDVSIDLAHDDVPIEDRRPKTTISTTTTSPSHPPDDTTTTTSHHPHLTLTARIPEKTNLSCQSITGNITLTSKLESDDHAHLDCDGDIVVDSKIRAQNIVLRSQRGTIAVRKQLEGDVVSLTARRRLRCRLLHGRDVSVTVGDDNDGCQRVVREEQGEEEGPWDEDDALALVDIGSLYTSKNGMAKIDVVGSGYDGRCVRVKSHHGHTSITTHYSPPTTTTAKTSPRPPPSSTKHDQRPPAVVELGGVNGSCDVTVTSSPSIPSSSSFVAARVHVDSLTPDGVSIISCQKGNVELTVDRKVETDVRLLSLPSLSSEEEEEEKKEEEDNEEKDEDITSFCDRILTMEDERDITDALRLYNKGMMTSINKRGGNIDILTEAFQPMGQKIHNDNESHDHDSSSPTLDNSSISYATGRLINNSHEPPSRFDVSVKGKIDIDGARAQALVGFGGSGNSGGGGGGGPNNNDSADVAFPLVAAGTVGGHMSLETVSWFGAIARRYGMMEDGKGMVDVGRQAGRRGRWDK